MLDPTLSVTVAAIATAVFGYWISKKGDETKRLSSLEDKLISGYQERILSLEKEITVLRMELEDTKQAEKRCAENGLILINEITELKIRLARLEEN